MTGLLFLCVSNSARSQMAEGIARALAPDLTVYSAGSAPTDVRPEAIVVMLEIGIELSRHKSKSIDDIPSAEIATVVTLCAEHLPDLLRARRAPALEPARPWGGRG